MGIFPCYSCLLDFYRGPRGNFNHNRYFINKDDLNSRPQAPGGVPTGDSCMLIKSKLSRPTAKLQPKLLYLKSKPVLKAQIMLSGPFCFSGIQSKRVVTSCTVSVVLATHKQPSRILAGSIITNVSTKHPRNILIAVRRLWLLCGGLSMADSTGWNVITTLSWCLNHAKYKIYYFLLRY